MSFREKFAQQYAKSYFKKNGDRLTQVQGNIVSVKIEKKSILWIFHKLIVTILVRPDRSKSIQKCIFRKNRWFKKPQFIPVSQGNLVIVQGMKGKKGKKSKENRETILIMNVKNLTTKKDLIPVEGKAGEIKRVQKVQKFQK